MHNWFECKIKYEKTLEEGNVQKVSESYLVDALSFTEAEARITEEMRPFITGEFEVANIRRIRIAEIFPNENGDRWYRCKVMYITIDEEKGVEKRTAQAMFVQATNIEDALEGLTQGMGNSLVDYEIVAITETALLDVYFYEAQTDKTPMSPEEKIARGEEI